MQSHHQALPVQNAKLSVWLCTCWSKQDNIFVMGKILHRYIWKNMNIYHVLDIWNIFQKFTRVSWWSMYCIPSTDSIPNRIPTLPKSSRPPPSSAIAGAEAAATAAAAAAGGIRCTLEQGTWWDMHIPKPWHRSLFNVWPLIHLWLTTKIELWVRNWQEGHWTAKHHRRQGQWQKDQSATSHGAIYVFFEGLTGRDSDAEDAS